MQQFKKYKFLKDLEEFKNLDLLPYKDCNIMCNRYQEKYIQIIYDNRPQKTLSKKEKKLDQNSCTSKASLTSIKIKDICKNKIFSGMKDINFIEIRTTS